MTTSFVKLSASGAIPFGEIASLDNTTGGAYFVTSEAVGTLTVAKIASGAISWQSKVASPSGGTIDETSRVLISTNASGDVFVAVHDTGTKSYVMKLNGSTGALTWIREVFPRVRAICGLADGGVFIGLAAAVGAVYSDIIAVKLSSAAGATSWSTQLVDDDFVGTTDPFTPADSVQHFHGAPVELSGGDIVLTFTGPNGSGVGEPCVCKLNSSGVVQWTRRFTWNSGGTTVLSRLGITMLGVGSAGDLWAVRSGYPRVGSATGVLGLNVNTSTGAVVASSAFGLESSGLSGLVFNGTGNVSVCNSGALVIPAITDGGPGFFVKPIVSAPASYYGQIYFAVPPSTFLTSNGKSVAGYQTSNHGIVGVRNNAASPATFVLAYTDAILGAGSIAERGANGGGLIRQDSFTSYNKSLAAHTTTAVTPSVSTSTASLANTSKSSSVTTGGLIASSGITAVPTGFSSTAIGTPHYVFVAPATGSLFTTGFGTPAKNLNRTLAATGAAASTALGTPDADFALRVPASPYATGINAAPTFGTPAAAVSATLAATGTTTTALGTPTSTSVAAATGIGTTAFGTAQGHPSFAVTGVRSTAVGSPAVALRAGVLAVNSTRFGTTVATWRITAASTGSSLTVFGSAHSHLHFNPRSVVLRTAFGASQASGV